MLVDQSPDVVLSGKLKFKKNDSNGIALALESSGDLDIANVRITDTSILPEGFTPEWFDVDGTWSLTLSFTERERPPRMSDRDIQAAEEAARLPEPKSGKAKNDKNDKKAKKSK